MSAQRRQRYFLDFDDVIDPSLMTTVNTNNLIQGMNANGLTALGTNIGGLGNVGSAWGSVYDGYAAVYQNSSKTFIPGTFANPGDSYTKSQSDAFMAGKTASGAISEITVTNGGSGYTSAPTVVITPTSGGTGAAATAIVVGGAVTAIYLTNVGSGYGAAPTISFTGGGGSSAAATASVAIRYTLDWQQVVQPIIDWSIITNKPATFGSNIRYLPAPILIPGPAAIVTFSGGTGGTLLPTAYATVCGNGYGATATITVSGGGLATVTIVNGGFDYVAGAGVSVVGGTGVVTITTGANGTITGATVTTAGTGYTAGAATFSGGAVTGIVVTYGGAGYSVAPTVTVTGVNGNGSGATGWTAAISGGAVTGISGGSGGSGYATSPIISVSVTGSTGTNAMVVPVISSMVAERYVISNSNPKPLQGLILVNGGTGYAGALNVSISGGGVGSPNATATGTLSGSGSAVGSVTLTSPGTSTNAQFMHCTLQLDASYAESYTWMPTAFTDPYYGGLIPANASGVILYLEMVTEVSSGAPGADYQFSSRANLNSPGVIGLHHVNSGGSAQTFWANSEIVTVPIDPSLSFYHQLVYDAFAQDVGAFAMYVVGYTIG